MGTIESNNMKKVKVFIDATYADRQSFNNRIQRIVTVKEDFDLGDIIEKIPYLEYSDGYTIKDIKVLSTIKE